jgi:hypothetical protein
MYDERGSESWAAEIDVRSAARALRSWFQRAEVGAGLAQNAPDA